MKKRVRDNRQKVTALWLSWHLDNIPASLHASLQDKTRLRSENSSRLLNNCVEHTLRMPPPLQLQPPSRTGRVVNGHRSKASKKLSILPPCSSNLVHRDERGCFLQQSWRNRGHLPTTNSSILNKNPTLSNYHNHFLLENKMCMLCVATEEASRPPRLMSCEHLRLTSSSLGTTKTKDQSDTRISILQSEKVNFRICRGDAKRVFGR